jgi:hypothetical protein
MRPLRSGPGGQTSYDATLRALAQQENFEDALGHTEEDYADDAGDSLLLLMHRGLLQHYAGLYEDSNDAFQLAELIVDDRYTRSISRAVLSLVTNDRALAYMPNRAERLMINYFGALNYLALGDVEEAAVEARRLSYLLERTEELEHDLAETGLRRALRYFAGTVFEAAGQMNDALVAYRHVWPDVQPGGGRDHLEEIVVGADAATAVRAIDVAGAEAGLLPILLQPVAGAPSEETVGEGDVVVVLESGFVAHRVERSRQLVLSPGEADALTDSDTDIRFAAASCVATRSFGDVSDFSGLSLRGDVPWSLGDGGQCEVAGASRTSLKSAREREEDEGEDAKDDDRPLELRVAWPEIDRTGGVARSASVEATLLASAAASETPSAAAIQLPATPPEEAAGGAPSSDPPPGRELPGAAGTGPRMRAPSGMNVDLSGSVIEEFQAGLDAVLVKTIARSAAKYAIVRAIDDDGEDDDKVLREIARLTAGAAVALFERADTRSWHLLPAGLSIARLRLPAGRHSLSMEIVEDLSGPRLVELGEIEVPAGGVRVLTARIWP